MSVIKSRLNEILNTNLTQNSSKISFTESSQGTCYLRTKSDIPNGFSIHSFKALQSKPKKPKFDISKSLSELGFQQSSKTRQPHGLFYNEEPTPTTTTSSNFDRFHKQTNLEPSSSSYNNFSFSLAKSQLKNMHHSATPVNNSFTYTRSNSKTHSRIQRQIEEISKVLNDKPQPKGGNLIKPTFTEVNIDQKDYLNISPFNLRKNILAKATQSVTQAVKGKGRNFKLTPQPQQNSIFDFLSKDKQGRIPLMNRKYLFEQQETEAEDFYSSLVNANGNKANKPNQFLNNLSTESNFLTKHKAKINTRSLSQKLQPNQKVAFNF